MKAFGFYKQHSARGWALYVHLTPKSSKDEWGGTVHMDGRLYPKAKVTAIPDKGAANKALLAFAAKQFSVPKTDIKLYKGSKSRIKTLLIAQASAQKVHEFLVRFATDDQL